jgi:hypothetical protein
MTTVLDPRDWPKPMIWVAFESGATVADASAKPVATIVEANVFLENFSISFLPNGTTESTWEVKHTVCHANITFNKQKVIVMEFASPMMDCKVFRHQEPLDDYSNPEWRWNTRAEARI